MVNGNKSMYNLDFYCPIGFKFCQLFDCEFWTDNIIDSTGAIIGQVSEISCLKKDEARMNILLGVAS